MKYTDKHADYAIKEFAKRLKFVNNNAAYDNLLAIMNNKQTWHKAHNAFTRIRAEITLPLEKDANKMENIEYYFCFVAEQAAKVIYNCSGKPAPFDSDSYDRLIDNVSSFDGLVADKGIA